MAGTVYLRTNHFEAKLEGITFKTKVFESLCKKDFLFPDGKDHCRDRAPIVGIDVMRHPRDPSILLLLLSFGVGCVILRFGAGETLPAPIQSLLSDRRIRFVGFGIPEKEDLFPFHVLGLRKNEVDIGYLAAKILKNPKYERYELAELARKVLGIKRMVGLTDASSFERHEQIKSAICQLFITSLIAMGLLGANYKKRLDFSSMKGVFLKNLNSLHLLVEGLFKLPKTGKRKQDQAQECTEKDEPFYTLGYEYDKILTNQESKKEGPFVDNLFYDSANHSPSLAKAGDSSADTIGSGYYTIATDRKDSDIGGGDSKEGYSTDGSGKEQLGTARKPLKGILKSPSGRVLQWSNSSSSTTPSSPTTPPADHTAAATERTMRRANSKGHNVSFKFR